MKGVGFSALRVFLGSVFRAKQAAVGAGGAVRCSFLLGFAGWRVGCTADGCQGLGPWLLVRDLGVS